MRHAPLLFLSFLATLSLPAIAGVPGTRDRGSTGPGAGGEEGATTPIEEGGDTQDIYGGGLIGDAEYPDTAALTDRWGVFCTGTLIAPGLVLTAAHCLEGGAPPDEVELGGGKAAGGETIGVKRVLRYPNGLSTYDLGLVFLEEEAETPPRPLALDCVAEEALVDGAEVTLAGFGETEQAARSGRKNAVDTTIVDADCDRTDAFDCIGRVSPGGELVAGGKGRDTCYGDSGGPLYLHTPQGTFLAGVTSRGATWDGDCGDGGIYVRPDAVVDWIEAEGQVDLPRPDCAVSYESELEELAAAASSETPIGGCQENSIHSVAALLVLPGLLGLRRRRTGT